MAPPPDASPRTALLIGRRPDVAGLAGRPGLRACYGPSWTLGANFAFLEDLVPSPVALASPPPAAGASGTFFAWEWGWLGLHGRAEAPPGWEAWARPGDPCLEALARNPAGFLGRIAARAAAGETRIPEFGAAVARMAWAAAPLDQDLARAGRDLLRLGTPYAPSLRYALAFAARMDALARAEAPGLPVEFEPKVRGELEGLLALFPHVLAFPTFGPLGRGDLVRLRSVPAHPLGLALAPRFVDGARRSPLEFFLHDLDHARYKVREDLALGGWTVRDPYHAAPGGTGATTLEDPRLGRHRTLFDQVDPACFRDLRTRRPLLDPRRLFAALAGWPLDLRTAAEALLFELLHEKSLPLDPRVLARESAKPGHAAKLRSKLAGGFLGDAPCEASRLEAAGAALARLVPALSP